MELIEECNNRSDTTGVVSTELVDVNELGVFVCRVAMIMRFIVIQERKVMQ